MAASRPVMLRLPHKIDFYHFHLRGHHGYGSVRSSNLVINTVFCLAVSGLGSYLTLVWGRNKGSGGKDPKTFSPEWKAAEEEKSKIRKADPIQSHVPGTKL